MACPMPLLPPVSSAVAPARLHRSLLTVAAAILPALSICARTVFVVFGSCIIISHCTTLIYMPGDEQLVKYIINFRAVAN